MNTQTDTHVAHRVGFVLVILLDVLSVAICASVHAEPVLMDGVAAYVNEQAITIGDVLAAMEPARRQWVGKLTGEELKSKLRTAYQETLESLIERKLILASYEKQKMRIPESAADQKINEIIHDSFKDDRSALLDALAQDGLTYEDWRKEMKNQVIAAAMRHQVVERNVHVAPSAARVFYDAHLGQYTVPARAKLRMIVINKTAAAETEAKQNRAQEALGRLKTGEDFAAVAKALSEDDKAAEGGDWGWIEPKLLRPELASVVPRLRAGGTSPIVETPDALYIVKIEEQQPDRATPFQEVRLKIEKDLENQQSKGLYETWVRRLKDEASVRVQDVDLF